MKRAISILLMTAMLVSMVAVLPASAADVLYGDVDGNGKINNRDLGRLQQYLNEWDVEINLDACDVDGNGKVNNRDLGRLQQYLNEWDVTLGPDEPEDPDTPNPPDVPDVPSVPSAALPEVGYDLDGRGRIFVKEISQQGNVVTVTLENISGKWMTEETSYVQYTCTDAEGNVLTMEDRYFGTLYFGMLEAKEVDTYTFNIPTGTAKVEFGTCRVVYWTQWS